MSNEDSLLEEIHDKIAECQTLYRALDSYSLEQRKSKARELDIKMAELLDFLRSLKNRK
jgi:hypothetical protein